MTDEMMSLLCAIRCNFALSEQARTLLPDAIDKGYVMMVPCLTETGDTAVDKYADDTSLTEN